MQPYSAWQLARQALRGHRDWPTAWRKAEPKTGYDVLIIGGGGHGLATAYYLAANHGITNVAVLERGWIGSGNIGRNTTIVRSNYMIDGNTPFYEHSMKLWEGLSQDLNLNVMLSQRGHLILGHSAEQMHAHTRRANTMRAHGIDAEILDREDLMREVPYLDFSRDARFPLEGAILQRRAGTARHDAVAWGYARAADRLGVDIIENCEVHDFHIEGGRVQGVETSRGPIGAERVGLVVAGETSQLAQKAGLELPIESHVLQAFVTEGIKPAVNHVVSFAAEQFYISQSDKGGLVFGGHLDGYNSYAARGNLAQVDSVVEIGLAALPQLSRLRLLRHWGGVVDMTMDGSPIIDRTPIDGLYLNGGWCYTGFKATPASGWTFAHTVAHDAAHELNAPYTLERFRHGVQIDEAGSGPVPKAH